MSRDFWGIVEAAYAMASSDSEWTQVIADAALPLLDQGLGIAVYTYDISDPRAFKADNVSVSGGIGFDHRTAVRSAEELPPKQALAFYRVGKPVAFARDVAASGETQTAFASLGIHDALGVFGHDPSHRGVIIAAASLRQYQLPSRSLGTLRRVGAHLAAAWRLRFQNSVALDAADALFDCASGKLRHQAATLGESAEGGKLTPAIERFVSGRKLRAQDPEQSLELWRALVAGRWSVLERADTDGKRYLVAQRNPARVAEPAALQPSERAVIQYAAWGHSNKFIAYELGLSPARISELLRSALDKLGMHSRAELVSVFSASARDEGVNGSTSC